MVTNTVLDYIYTTRSQDTAMKQSYSIDLFADTAAILNSIVSTGYNGMPRGQISMYLPPEHPIIGI